MLAQLRAFVALIRDPLIAWVHTGVSFLVAAAVAWAITKGLPLPGGFGAQADLIVWGLVQATYVFLVHLAGRRWPVVLVILGYPANVQYGNRRKMRKPKSRRKARALGLRKPSRKPALMLRDYLTGALPAYPAAADHFAKVSDWGLYANDRFGDCGPASVANSRKLVTRYLTSSEQSPTLDDVFDLYRRSGNPHFNPANGADDNGVDMQTMLEAVVKGGIGGVKALGFAKINPKDLYELRAAVAIFGFVLLGVELETAQQTQTDTGLWDYKASPTWGGHAVLCGRYGTSPIDRTAVITWADVVDTTDTFLNRQLGEAWVVIWPEHLTDNGFLAGVDLAAFARDYEAITGQAFPAPLPAPQPTPTPTPDPTPTPPPAPPLSAADAALAAVAVPFVAKRHTGAVRDMAKALKVWLAAKSQPEGSTTVEVHVHLYQSRRQARRGRHRKTARKSA